VEGDGATTRLFEGSEGTFRSFDLEAETLAEEPLRPLDVLNTERDDDAVAHREFPSVAWRVPSV
jgi:hypothetical protein